MAPAYPWCAPRPRVGREKSTANPLVPVRTGWLPRAFATETTSLPNFESWSNNRAFRSPWQNGVAERWVGSCRRDMLDHVIVLNERHLKRLMAEYVRYYHEDRTHLGLAKDTPAHRPIATRSAVGSKIQSFPRLGGLHHRYGVAA